nr:hypothetical protein [Tanacetum cinerariifolium]
DAKKLLEAVEKRFSGIVATKNTQRNLLKQHYENFTTSSSEILDQTFDRLQKLVSQLELLEEKLSQEDVNQKLLRSRGRAKLCTHGFLILSSKSEVSNDSTCLKSCLETVKLLKSENDQLLKDIKKSMLMVRGYKTGLESVEERLEFYKTNKSIFLKDIKGLKVEIQIGEIAIRKLREKLKIAQKEKDGIQLNVDKFKHAYKSLNKLIECQIVDNCKKGLGYENYNEVSLPYIGNFMPSTPDLSFTGLDDFVNKHVVENYKAKSSKEEPKVVKNNDDALIIEE